jgi:hypothetical protein
MTVSVSVRTGSTKAYPAEQPFFLADQAQIHSQPKVAFRAIGTQLYSVPARVGGGLIVFSKQKRVSDIGGLPPGFFAVQ